MAAHGIIFHVLILTIGFHHVTSSFLSNEKLNFLLSRRPTPETNHGPSLSPLQQLGLIPTPQRVDTTTESTTHLPPTSQSETSSGSALSAEFVDSSAANNIPIMQLKIAVSKLQTLLKQATGDYVVLDILPPSQKVQLHSKLSETSQQTDEPLDQTDESPSKPSNPVETPVDVPEDNPLLDFDRPERYSGGNPPGSGLVRREDDSSNRRALENLVNALARVV